MARTKRTKRSTKRNTKRNTKRSQKGAGHGKPSRAAAQSRISKRLAALRASRVNPNAMNIGSLSSRPTRKAAIKYSVMSNLKALRKLNKAESKKTAAKNFSKTMKQQAAAHKEAKRMETIAEGNNFESMFKGLTLNK